ncbi:MAG TPA: hypothetical protein VJA16_15715 [Thermoanaerobaculia bacterium]
MPSWEELTPQDWNEGDSFLETAFLHIQDHEDREALRRVGRLIYNMSLEVRIDQTLADDEESQTRAELRAVLADLRHVQGFLACVLRESVESSLDADEQALSVLAGSFAGRVAAIADALEEELR